jgi:hypothetical protein
MCFVWVAPSPGERRGPWVVAGQLAGCQLYRQPRKDDVRLLCIYFNIVAAERSTPYPSESWRAEALLLRTTTVLNLVCTMYLQLIVSTREDLHLQGVATALQQTNIAPD